MDKFIEFLKNNTAVVAVVAGIVLFIAMNGITSCVAKGNAGDDAGSPAIERKSEKEPQKGSDPGSKTELTERQRAAIKDYDQETKRAVEQIERSKWAANDGSGSLTVKDGVITETYGEAEGTSKKTKKQVQTFAITAVDSIAADQTGALSWEVFSVVDGEGNDHIMTLTRTDPAALTGEGNDTYFELKCDMFHNENGYSNNRCAENAKINGIDNENLKQAIDGHTKKFKQSVIEYLLANHSTTTELTWDGTVIENFSESTRTLTFSIENATNAAEDSLPSMLVIYHTDTHEFEEVDVQ